MTNTQIMLNFMNYITNEYGDEFEIQRIIQHEKYEYRFTVVTKLDDYNLIILCTHGNNLCIQWMDDIYYHADGEWKCLATFY